MQKTGSNRKNIGERSKPSGAVGEGERPTFPLTRLPLRIGLRSLIVYFAHASERSKPSGAVGEGERPPFPFTKLPLRIGLRSLIVYFAHANFFLLFPLTVSRIVEPPSLILTSFLGQRSGSGRKQKNFFTIRKFYSE